MNKKLTTALVAAGLLLGVLSKFKRAAVCVFASTALMLSGCAVTPAQSPAPSPAATADTTPSAKAAGATPSKPAVDYGPVAGNFTIHASNTDGYTATIKVVAHKPTLVSSTKEMPAWCAAHFSNESSSRETLNQASSIISRTVESTVTLDQRPGFPEPSKWAPTPKTSAGLFDRTGLYPGYGTCSSNSAGGAAATLTAAGYQTVMADIAYGRSTPAKPLPAKVEEVASSTQFTLWVSDAVNCSIEPAEGFTFGKSTSSNSPEANNGLCNFALVAKAG